MPTELRLRLRPEVDSKIIHSLLRSGVARLFWSLGHSGSFEASFPARRCPRWFLNASRDYQCFESTSLDPVLLSPQAAQISYLSFNLTRLE